jgi:hypothetical protein
MQRGEYRRLIAIIICNDVLTCSEIEVASRQRHKDTVS